MKKRIIQYDIIKTIATFMVVFFHFSLLDFEYTQGSFYIPNINRIFMNICVACVPLFFMVSGALFLSKKPPIKKVITKVSKLAFLYLFWNLITYLINSFIIGDFGEPRISQFLLGSLPNQAPLWYLRALAILFFLSPLLYKIYNLKSKLPISLIISAIFIYPFLYNFSFVIGVLFDMPELIRFNTGLFNLYSILYFLMGIIIVDYNKSDNKKNIIGLKIFAFINIIIGLFITTYEGYIKTNALNLMFDSINGCFPTIGALTASFGIFYLIFNSNLNINPKMSKFITHIADNSLGIYILHSTFICIYKVTIGAKQNIFASVLLTILVIAICDIITTLIKKIPYVKEIMKV